MARRPYGRSATVARWHSVMWHSLVWHSVMPAHAGIPPFLHNGQDADGRDIGERSDAVLRTAMPGDDDAVRLSATLPSLFTRSRRRPTTRPGRGPWQARTNPLNFWRGSGGSRSR